MNKYSKYSRAAKGPRSYRKMFLVATEGDTEQDYLRIIQGMVTCKIRITPIGPKKGNSPPPQVVARMEQARKDNDLRRGDEAWLIIDKDAWSNSQLGEAIDWAAARLDRGCALSNPKFEYWLLLHFEKPAAGLTGKSCEDQLRTKHLDDYDKHLNATAFTRNQIERAINRAKAQDKNREGPYPLQNGSTVYRLIESIFNSSDTCC